MAVQGALITPTRVRTWVARDDFGNTQRFGIFYSALANGTAYATGGGDFVDFSKWFKFVHWADVQVVQVAAPIGQYNGATSATLSGAVEALGINLAYGQDITPANLPGFGTAVAANNAAVVYVQAAAHAHGASNTYATATLTRVEVGTSTYLTATGLNWNTLFGRWYVVGE